VLWHGEACGADADFGKAAGAGGSDGPVILRKRLQNFESAGEGNYTLGVFDFAALYFAIFDDGIGVREEIANGGDAGTAVGLADDFVGYEAVLVGPDGPDAGYGGGGVDENAVEIEEHTAAVNFHGSMIPSFGAGFCALAPQQLGVTCKWKKR